MVTLSISGSLAATLNTYAEREGHSLEHMLEKLLIEYNRTPPEERDIDEQAAAMEAISRLFDDEVTDLSLTVNESAQNHLRKKYGSPR
jgi:hypothetical protein